MRIIIILNDIGRIIIRIGSGNALHTTGALCLLGGLTVLIAFRTTILDIITIIHRRLLREIHGQIHTYGHIIEYRLGITTFKNFLDLVSHSLFRILLNLLIRRSNTSCRILFVAGEKCISCIIDNRNIVQRLIAKRCCHILSNALSLASGHRTGKIQFYRGTGFLLICNNCSIIIRNIEIDVRIRYIF